MEFEEKKQMNMMGADEYQHDKIARKSFKELRFDEIDATPKEAREMVLKSNMLIVHGMIVKQIFLLVEFDSNQGVSGTGITPKQKHQQHG